MSSYYTGVMALTVLCMLAMVVNARRSAVLGVVRRNGFTAAFVAVAVVAFAEWLGVLCQEIPGTPRELHALAKVLEFSAAPFIPLLMAFCFEEHFTLHNRVLGAVFAAHALLEVASGFATAPGLVFYVDDADVYHRSSLYWVYLAALVVAILFFFRRAVLFSRSYQNRNLTSLWFSFAAIVVGMIVQFADSTVRITWLTVSIVAIFLFIYLKDLVQQVDPVTKILNRVTFDNHVGALRHPVVLILIDVDKFKNVNDTHGHAFGDVCLHSVGQTMCQVYGRCGTSFRIGGDEFAVLLERDLNRLDELDEAFYRAMERLREEDPRIPSASIGYAHFDPAVDSIEGAMLRADKMLYEHKRALACYADAER